MFSDRQLKSLKPRKHAYRVFEKAHVPGFCIRVTPKGVKTFYLQFTLNQGKPIYMSLGRYPGVSLQEARERAVAAREDVERGHDPRVTSGAANSGSRRAGTVGDAVDLYIEDMMERGKTSAPAVRRIMEKDVLPWLGDMLARDVTPRHIQEVVARVIQRDTRFEHEKARHYMHAVFQFALHYDYDPRAKLRGVRFGLQYNPVAAVPGDKTAARRTRDRNLTFNEIGLMWRAKWHDVPLLSLRLILALGGLRPVEVLGLRDEEMTLGGDEPTVVVPPERFKGRRHHVVPVSPLALSVIEQLLERRKLLGLEESGFLIPAVTSDNQMDHYARNSLSQYVRRQWDRKTSWPDGLARFIPYDLRRTAKTRMGEMGIDKSLRDRIQGHAMSDVSSKHYDRWDYLPEKREALDQWGSKLASIAADPSA